MPSTDKVSKKASKLLQASDSIVNVEIEADTKSFAALTASVDSKKSTFNNIKGKMNETG